MAVIHENQLKARVLMGFDMDPCTYQDLGRTCFRTGIWSHLGGLVYAATGPLTWMIDSKWARDRPGHRNWILPAWAAGANDRSQRSQAHQMDGQCITGRDGELDQFENPWQRQVGPCPAGGRRWGWSCQQCSWISECDYVIEYVV